LPFARTVVVPDVALTTLAALPPRSRKKKSLWGGMSN